jgi:hypothetical protein
MKKTYAFFNVISEKLNVYILIGSMFFDSVFGITVKTFGDEGRNYCRKKFFFMPPY